MKARIRRGEAGFTFLELMVASLLATAFAMALSSAGVMKTACTQRQWDLADRAMAELKERYPSVDPETQKFLDYWIRTGEPRLKKRKC